MLSLFYVYSETIVFSVLIESPTQAFLHSEVGGIFIDYRSESNSVGSIYYFKIKRLLKIEDLQSFSGTQTQVNIGCSSLTNYIIFGSLRTPFYGYGGILNGYRSFF